MNVHCRLLSSFVLALLLAFIGSSSAVAQVQHGGEWTAKGYEIAGRWSVVVDGDRRFLELDGDFETRKAPDLKLFLSPLDLEELNDGNATRGAVLIAPLTAHRGEARYEIAPTIDLEAFETLILHCERYAKLWGGAPISTASPGSDD